MLWVVRKIHSAHGRTLSLGPVEGRLNEEEAGKGEGDWGSGFGDLVGNDDGKKAAE